MNRISAAGAWETCRSMLAGIAPKPVVVHDARFVPIPNDEILGKVAAGEAFEHRELALVRALLRTDSVFWDVGANFGLFTIIAAQAIGGRGNVVAIEPDPRNANRLLRNIRLNGLRNVQVERIALGDTSGFAPFNSCDQGAYSGLRTAVVPAPTRTIQVPQRRIDEVAARLDWPAVDLLKMDVEGNEWFVIKGGTTFFAKRPRPIVITEFSDRRTVAYGYQAADIYDALSAMDYAWYQFGPNGHLQPHKRQDYYDYDNLVACPTEKLSRLAEWRT